MYLVFKRITDQKGTAVDLTGDGMVAVAQFFHVKDERVLFRFPMLYAPRAATDAITMGYDVLSSMFEVCRAKTERSYLEDLWNNLFLALLCQFTMWKTI